MTPTPSRPNPPTAHLDEELLTSYVSTDLPDHQCEEIERHLNRCDQCLDLLVIAHERIILADEVSAAVPAAVVQRVDALLATAPAPRLRTPERARPVGMRPWLTAVADRLSAFSRLPVLMPVSFAVGVMFMLVTHNAWMSGTANRSTTRSIEVQWTIRVAVPEAIVRAEPHPQAAIVGRVARGQVVEVNEEEREWYRATLPSGTEGWIERHAFE